MKKKDNCTPISSNCVVWQGPDIPCIKLCKGDSITDVVYNFAMSYCDLLQQLDPSKYDLSCLNDSSCPPESFHALIQLLIEKICDIEKQEGPQGPAGNDGNDGADGDTIELTTLPFDSPQCPCGGTIIEIFSPGNPVPTDQYILCSGCDGDDGAVGEAGPVGPPGQAGLPGAQGDPGQDGICEDCVDTGWYNLLGFCHQQNPPQARRIGNTIHFRGFVLVPLTNGVGGFLAQSPSPGRLYEESRFVAPAVGGFPCAGGEGAGTTGVELDTSGGAIRFNNHQNVIPPEVLNMGTNSLDGAYRIPLAKGTRRVLVAREADFGAEQIISANVEAEYAGLVEGTDTTTHPTGQPANTSAMLSTIANVIVQPNGRMLLTMVRDGEDTAISTYRTSYSFNTSHLNYLISHVRLRDNVFTFRADGSGTTIHGNQSSVPPVQHVDADYDLLNGHTSTATSKYKYKMNCNANDETELGGFAFNIDGLIAYIAP